MLSSIDEILLFTGLQPGEGDVSGITKDDIQKFIENRNELTHRMDFANEEKPETFWFMADFIAKFLLGILHYNGHYLDNSQRSQNEWIGEIRHPLSVDEAKACWPYQV